MSMQADARFGCIALEVEVHNFHFQSSESEMNEGTKEVLVLLYNLARQVFNLLPKSFNYGTGPGLICGMGAAASKLFYYCVFQIQKSISFSTS